MRQEAIGDPWSVRQALEAAGDAVDPRRRARPQRLPEDVLAALAEHRRSLLVDARAS